MNDCIFCRIVTGRAPGSIFHADEEILALLDLHPVNRGHALIIPRVHYRDLAVCPPPLAGALFAAAQRVGPVLVEVLKADGFNVWTANGAAAGQEVFHLHLHVLPRFRKDTFGLRFPRQYPRKASRQDLDALAATLRSRL